MPPSFLIGVHLPRLQETYAGALKHARTECVLHARHSTGQDGGDDRHTEVQQALHSTLKMQEPFVHTLAGLARVRVRAHARVVMWDEMWVCTAQAVHEHASWTHTNVCTQTVRGGWATAEQRELDSPLPG